MNSIAILFVMLSLLLPAGVSAQIASPIVKDIVYGRSGGISLKLDMAKPGSGNGPFPVILHFHGGGWQAGDKSHGHERIVKLAGAGYVAVSVGYRFAPQFKWPSQVNDARAAIRFLLQHAQEYNIDPDRIGVVGDSAGGYLALMAGLADKADMFDADTLVHISTTVKAVVTFCSAGDFSRSGQRKLPREVEEQITEYYKKPLGQVLAEFTGTTDPDDPKLTRMSARSYVNAGDPPVLIFQGEVDPLISMEQVEELDHALKAAGVHSEVVVVKGAGHGWYGALLDDTEKQMIAFFDQWVKKQP